MRTQITSTDTIASIDLADLRKKGLYLELLGDNLTIARATRDDMDTIACFQEAEPMPFGETGSYCENYLGLHEMEVERLRIDLEVAAVKAQFLQLIREAMILR